MTILKDNKISKETEREILELIRLCPKHNFFSSGFKEDFIRVDEFKKLIKKYVEK